MLSPKLIMSPIDFSEHSDKALEVAIEMAALYRAEVCLAHVVPAIPDLPSPGAIFHEREYDEALDKDAQSRLEEIARTISERGLKSRIVIGTANEVGMELLRMAEQNGVDLIVIATHGMTGWRRLRFGSVAEKVVREAECAVLVLRASPPKQ